MKKLLTAFAIAALFVQPAHAARWQQKRVDVLNCMGDVWTPAVIAMVAEWNACKVVTLSLVNGTCPGSPAIVTGKVALFAPDCTDYIGITAITSNTLITWAVTKICDRSAVYNWSDSDRHYTVGHEMGHAIGGLLHVSGLSTSIMSPSIVNPHVTSYDCSTLKSMYKGH